MKLVSIEVGHDLLKNVAVDFQRGAVDVPSEPGSRVHFRMGQR